MSVEFNLEVAVVKQDQLKRELYTSTAV